MIERQAQSYSDPGRDLPIDSAIDAANDPWVFGYGSLMWRPDFPYIERRPGLLYGFHRSFCVYSYHHRGTPDNPGLVLGLDRGGACRGIAYRVAHRDWQDVVSYLKGREQVTEVYQDIYTRVRLGGNPRPSGERNQVRALTYMVDREHIQYAGRLAFDDQVRHILNGVGHSGKNPDYLKDMVAHLDQMGWRDLGLLKLWQKVERALRESEIKD